MRKLLLIVAVAMCLALPSVAVGQGTGPTVVSEARFEVTGQPAQFDLIQRVIDFPPGSGTPVHNHSGPQFAAVLSGVLTYQIFGKEEQYLPGRTWMEPTGEVHQGRNLSNGVTRLVATALAPRGVPLTNNLEPMPAGMLPLVIVQEAKVELSGQPSQFSVVQRVVDLPPGASIAPHVHGGAQYVLLMDGQVRLTLGGADKTYQAGEGWTEPADVPHSAVNTGVTTARLFTTALLPPGAVYSTPVGSPQALPVTGSPVAVVAWAWLLGGLGLVGLGARWRRGLT